MVYCCWSKRHSRPTYSGARLKATLSIFSPALSRMTARPPVRILVPQLDGRFLTGSAALQHCSVWVALGIDTLCSLKERQLGVCLGHSQALHCEFVHEQNSLLHCWPLSRYGSGFSIWRGSLRPLYGASLSHEARQGLVICPVEHGGHRRAWSVDNRRARLEQGVCHAPQRCLTELQPQLTLGNILQDDSSDQHPQQRWQVNPRSNVAASMGTDPEEEHRPPLVGGQHGPTQQQVQSCRQKQRLTHVALLSGACTSPAAIVGLQAARQQPSSRRGRQSHALSS